MQSSGDRNGLQYRVAVVASSTLQNADADPGKTISTLLCFLHSLYHQCNSVSATDSAVIIDSVYDGDKKNWPTYSRAMLLVYQR